MKPPVRRRANRTKNPDTTPVRGALRLSAGVRRQIDDIYLQLDTQLTRLAEIQLQFDRLRSTIRHL
jgi:hypothetical protein